MREENEIHMLKCGLETFSNSTVATGELVRVQNLRTILDLLNEHVRFDTIPRQFVCMLKTRSAGHTPVKG